MSIWRPPDRLLQEVQRMSPLCQGDSRDQSHPARRRTSVGGKVLKGLDRPPCRFRRGPFVVLWRGVFHPAETVRRPGSRPHGEIAMRFMMIVKATKDSEAGVMPSEKLIADMAKFHEDLQKAVVILDASVLQRRATGCDVNAGAAKLP